MKKQKVKLHRILNVAVILLLFCILVLPNSVNATEYDVAPTAEVVDGKIENKTVFTLSETDELTDGIEYYTSLEETAFYIRDCMKNRQTTFTVGYQTTEDYNEVLYLLEEKAFEHTGDPTGGDYLRWHISQNYCEATITTIDGVNYITLDYTVSYYTTAEQEAEMTQAVNALIDQLKLNDDLSDYQKISKIYDYICCSVVYDHAHVGDMEYGLQQSAYAALVKKTAVCQGYATLFYRLALEAGIDARCIGGVSMGENHMWNIVRLDVAYYNMDATWDAGRTDYAFFLKGDTDFSDHTRDTEYATDGFYTTYPMASIDYEKKHLWPSYRAERFAGGSGTEADPYLISTPEELALLAYNVSYLGLTYNDGYFLQTADIDLSAHEWVPVGVSGGVTSSIGFSGTFDGNGYTISGMYITNGTYCQYGLFGGLNGFLRNVKLQGASINVYNTAVPGLNLELAGAMSVGGIASELFGGTIENCTVDDLQVSVKTEYCGIRFGGVIGYASPGAFINNAAVTGDFDLYAHGCYSVGGIVGYIYGDADSTVENSWVTITQCGFRGKITADGYRLSDDAEDGITDSRSVGGVVGDAAYGYISITDCFSNADVLCMGGGSAGAIMGNVITWEECNFVFERLFSVSDVTMVSDDFVGGHGSSPNLIGSPAGYVTLDRTTWVPDRLSSYPDRSITITDCAMVVGSNLVKYGDVDPNHYTQKKTDDVYPLCSHTISDLFTSVMQYDASAWDIQDGHYPTLAGHDIDQLEAIHDHSWSSVGKTYTCEICSATKTGLNGRINPTITQQPTNVSACDGYPVSVTVIATGDDLTYEWWVSEEGEEAFFQTSEDTATYSCIVTDATDGRRVYCVINDAYGNSVTSDVATISMAIPQDGAGRNLMWHAGNKLLTISGAGPMYDFSSTVYTYGPWNAKIYDEESVIAIIEEGVTSIGGNAFFGCRTVINIAIPDSVTHIGYQAMGGCSALTSVSLPDAVTAIGEFAFNGCASLQKINIPKSLQRISQYAFSECTSLESIRIPESVTDIATYAFYNCSSLSQIVFEGDCPIIDDYVFTGVTATAYYPSNNKTWTKEVLRDYGGNITWVCKDVPREAHEHSYTASVIDPICTEEGYTAHVCTCGDAYVDNYVPAVGHNWWLVFDPEWKIHSGACEGCLEPIHAPCSFDEGEITIPATCTETGIKTFTCSVCGGSYTEEIKATGHTEAIEKAVGPTCTEPGRTEGKKCSTCGEILVAQEVIPATGHTEEIIPGKAATCTETGLTEGRGCSDCDEIIVSQEVIPATGHTEVIIPGEAATCTESGLTDGCECSVCGEITVAQEVIEALGHSYDSGRITREPTCTESGVKTLTCVRCSDSVEEEVEALGHSYKFGYCTVCGEEDPSEPVEIASGDCGTNVAWSLDSRGTLEIYGVTEPVTYNLRVTAPTLASAGNFRMDDYASSEEAPWAAYADQIARIQVDKLVTRIGSNAFSSCENLKDVAIGDGVESIGERAFADCAKLENVVIGESVTEVLDEAFAGCEEVVVTFIGDEPAVADSTFENTTATVNYPVGNETWEDESQNNYGENVTVQAHTHRYSEEITEATCLTDGYTTYTCDCGHKYQDDYVTAPGHKDEDHNHACDVCQEVISECVDEDEDRCCDICDTALGILGDVNDDGEVDVFDANLVVSYFYGSVDLTDAQIACADVNGDGEVDVFDANLIVSYFYGSIDYFPVEEN